MTQGSSRLGERNPTSRIPKSIRNINKTRLLILLLFGIWPIYFLAEPLHHAFIVLPSKYPATAVYLPLIVGYFVLTRHFSDHLSQPLRNTVFIIGIILVVTALVAHPLSTEARMNALSSDPSNTVTPTENLPEINPESQPSQSLTTCIDTANKTTRNNQTVKSESIVWVNEKPYCSFAHSPTDGKWLIGSQKSAGYTPLNHQETPQTVTSGPVRKGIGVVSWNTHRHAQVINNPAVEYRETFVITPSLTADSQEQIPTYITSKMISYDWKLKWGFIPYTIPEFAGVSVVSPDGSVKQYTPREAHQTELLESHPIYPRTLASQQATAHSRDVWHNRLLPNTGVTASSTNSRIPSTVHTSNGTPLYLLPITEKSDGSFTKLYIMNAVTGNQTEIYATGEQFISAESAEQSVKLHSPAKFNGDVWKHYETKNPRLIIRDEGLYWLTNIVETQSNEITAYAFVDASARSSVSFSTTAQTASEFVAGEQISPETTTRTEKTNDVETVVVIKRDGAIVGRYNATDDLSIEYTTADKSQNSSSSPN